MITVEAFEKLVDDLLESHRYRHDSPAMWELKSAIADRDKCLASVLDAFREVHDACRIFEAMLPKGDSDAGR